MCYVLYVYPCVLVPIEVRREFLDPYLELGNGLSLHVILRI